MLREVDLPACVRRHKLWPPETGRQVFCLFVYSLIRVAALILVLKKDATTTEWRGQLNDSTIKPFNN